MHFQNGSGPAKGLFSQIVSIFGDDQDLYSKKKLND